MVLLRSSLTEPVIQIDHCFHATSEELPLRKIFVKVSLVARLRFGFKVEAKGGFEDFEGKAKGDLKGFKGLQGA